MTYDPWKRGPRSSRTFESSGTYPVPEAAAGVSGDLPDAEAVTTARRHRRHVWISFAVASVTLFGLLVAADRQRTMYRAESVVAVEPGAAGSAGSGSGSRDGSYDRYVQDQARAMLSPEVLAAALARMPGGDPRRQEALARQIQVTGVPAEHRLLVRLTGPDAAQTARVVNAVTEAYLERGRKQATVRLDPTVLEAERELMAQLLVAERKERDLLRVEVGAGAPGVSGAAGPAPAATEDAGFAEARRQATTAREAHDVVLDRLFAVMRRGGFDPAAEVEAADVAGKGMREEIDRRRSELTAEMASLGQGDPVYRQDGQEMARLEESSSRLAGQMREQGAGMLMNRLRGELAQTGAQEVATNGAVADVVSGGWNPAAQRTRLEDLSTELPRLQGWMGTIDDLLGEIGRRAAQATLVAPAGVPTVAEPNYRSLLRYGAVPMATFVGFVMFVILSDLSSNRAAKRASSLFKAGAYGESEAVADRDGVVISVRQFWDDGSGELSEDPDERAESRPEGSSRGYLDAEMVPPGEHAPPLGDAATTNLSHTGFESGRDAVPEPVLDIGEMGAGRMAAGELAGHILQGTWGVPAMAPEADVLDLRELRDPERAQFVRRSAVVSLTPWEEPLEDEVAEVAAPEVAGLEEEHVSTEGHALDEEHSVDEEHPAGWFQRLFARQRSEAGTAEPEPVVEFAAEPEVEAAEKPGRREFATRRPSSLRLARVVRGVAGGTDRMEIIPEVAAARLARVLAPEHSVEVPAPEVVAQPEVVALPEVVAEREVPAPVAYVAAGAEELPGVAVREEVAAVAVEASVEAVPEVVAAPQSVAEPVSAEPVVTRPPRPLTYFELSQTEVEPLRSLRSGLAGKAAAAAPNTPDAPIAEPEAVAAEPVEIAAEEMEVVEAEFTPAVELAAEPELIPAVVVNEEVVVAEVHSPRAAVTRFRGRAARVARNGVRAYAGALDRPGMDPESVDEPEIAAAEPAVEGTQETVEPVEMQAVVAPVAPLEAEEHVEIVAPKEAVAETPAAPVPFRRWTSVDTAFEAAQAPEPVVPVRRSFAPSAGRSVWDLPAGVAEERGTTPLPETVAAPFQEPRRWGLLDRFAAQAGKPGESGV